MIHLSLATVYLVITLYYLCTPTLTFEQRLHASCASFMMLYSLFRHSFTVNDVPIFLLMHFCLYVVDGGRQQPFWMSVFVCKCLVFRIVALAEDRLYTLSSELHRVLPAWDYEFLYTHEAKPRLVVTNRDQQMDNDLLHEYVKTRDNDEVPVMMSAEEKRVWNLSDKHSILMVGTDRCVLSWSLGFWTMATYGLWWIRLYDGFRYYFVVDLVLFLALHCSWRIQLFVYHTAFSCAAIYLHYSDFNASLQNQNIVVH